jgi:hypothetical protein
VEHEAAALAYRLEDATADLRRARATVRQADDLVLATTAVQMLQAFDGAPRRAAICGRDLRRAAICGRA